ncbi:hypothetical protein IAT38_000347 [Cryptococcus sp. DSM 104549]
MSSSPSFHAPAPSAPSAAASSASAPPAPAPAFQPDTTPSIQSAPQESSTAPKVPKSRLRHNPRLGDKRKEREGEDGQYQSDHSIAVSASGEDSFDDLVNRCDEETNGKSLATPGNEVERRKRFKHYALESALKHSGGDAVADNCSLAPPPLISPDIRQHGQPRKNEQALEHKPFAAFWASPKFQTKDAVSTDILGDTSADERLRKAMAGRSREEYLAAAKSLLDCVTGDIQRPAALALMDRLSKEQETWRRLEERERALIEKERRLEKTERALAEKRAEIARLNEMAGGRL